MGLVLTRTFAHGGTAFPHCRRLGCSPDGGIGSFQREWSERAVGRFGYKVLVYNMVARVVSETHPPLWMGRSAMTELIGLKLINQGSQSVGAVCEGRETQSRK